MRKQPLVACIPVGLFCRILVRPFKKSQDYNLPHIYVLSLLTENQFPLERDTYLHHTQVVRNRHLFYDKLDVYLIEIEKFFSIEDRTLVENREKSNRAEMLRIFRDVLEEKNVPEEKLQMLLDKGFAKDVSLEGYTDEILLKRLCELPSSRKKKSSRFKRS